MFNILKQKKKEETNFKNAFKTIGPKFQSKMKLEDLKKATKTLVIFNLFSRLE